MNKSRPACQQFLATVYTLHWSVGESVSRWEVIRAGVALKLASLLTEKFNQFKQVLVVSQHKNIDRMKAILTHFVLYFQTIFYLAIHPYL